MSIPLTIIMPAYNEEAGIAAAVGEVVQHVFPLVPAAELVVVNDGSRDRTGAILDELAKTEPRLRVIHRANGGHGPALRTGLEAAAGEYLFLIDSDSQIPLQAFVPLWQAAQGRDGALGIRTHRADAPTRQALTWIIRRALRALFAVRLYDANVPFKIVRRTAWEQARGCIPADTLAPSLFLAVFMLQRKMDVVFQEVPHRDRATGVVSIRRWKLLKFCWRAFRQLWVFRRALNARGARDAH